MFCLQWSFGFFEDILAIFWFFTLSLPAYIFYVLGNYKPNTRLSTNKAQSFGYIPAVTFFSFQILYKVCLKSNETVHKYFIPNTNCKLQHVAFEVIPLRYNALPHPPLPCLHALWKTLSGIAHSSFIMAILTASTSGKHVPFMTPLRLGNRKNHKEPGLVSMEVAPAQQCYFWEEMPRCSMHCALEHCRGEAAMIFFIHMSPLLSHWPHQMSQDVPEIWWLMVWFCVMNSTWTMPLTSKKEINITLILDLAILGHLPHPPFSPLYLLCHSWGLDIVSSPYTPCSNLSASVRVFPSQTRNFKLVCCSVVIVYSNNDRP